MQTTRLALLAGVAGFAITWFMLGDARMRGDRSQLKDQVHTWEDEGGNVPDVQTVSPNKGIR
jgi:hypothetical protein